MKKRNKFLVLSLFVSQGMIYSMEQERDLFGDAPDRYHLTRYVVAQDLLEEDADLNLLHKKEDRMREDQDGLYGNLLEALHDGNVSEEHARLIVRSLTGVNVDKLAGYGQERKQKRIETLKKRIRELQASVEQLKWEAEEREQEMQQHKMEARSVEKQEEDAPSQPKKSVTCDKSSKKKRKKSKAHPKKESSQAKEEIVVPEEASEQPKAELKRAAPQEERVAPGPVFVPTVCFDSEEEVEPEDRVSMDVHREEGSEQKKEHESAHKAARRFLRSISFGKKTSHKEG